MGKNKRSSDESSNSAKKKKNEEPEPGKKEPIVEKNDLQPQTETHQANKVSPQPLLNPQTEATLTNQRNTPRPTPVPSTSGMDKNTTNSKSKRTTAQKKDRNEKDGKQKGQTSKSSKKENGKQKTSTQTSGRKYNKRTKQRIQQLSSDSSTADSIPSSSTESDDELSLKEQVKNLTKIVAKLAENKEESSFSYTHGELFMNTHERPKNRNVEFTSGLLAGELI